MTREDRRRIMRYLAAKWGLWDIYADLIIHEAMADVWPGKTYE
jgi:hypothetical protein